MAKPRAGASRRKFTPRTDWVDSPQELDNPDHFLDRLSILYGPSETGKTIMGRHILNTLGVRIPEGTFVTRTPKNFHEIPPPYIHEKFSLDLLQKIWDRQGARTVAYTKANRPHVLCRLAARVPSDKITRVVAEVERLRQAEQKKLGANSADFDALSKLCDDLIRQCYKVHVGNNLAQYRKMRLDDDESYSLKYLNFNPRHALVFDDVTSQLKKYQNKEIIQELFYAARNRYLTVIIMMHGDKILDAELRKNAHVSIFMNPAILKTFFKRESMDFEESIRSMALSIAANPQAFASFHKILFLKKRGPSKHPFVRVRARMHERITFGSRGWHELGNKIKGDGSADPDNPFNAEFQ
jgi:hypothetical protein